MAPVKTLGPMAVGAAFATLIVGLMRWAFPSIQGAIPGAEAALTVIFAFFIQRG